MRFDRECELEQATETSEGRYAFNYVRVAPTGGTTCRLSATQGRILVQIDGEVDPEDHLKPSGVLVPVEAIKAARKGASKYAMPRVTLTEKSAEVAAKGGATMAFPLGEKLFPSVDELVRIHTKRKPSMLLCINPTLLLAAAKAMGAAEGVVLEFSEDMLEVHPLDSEKPPEEHVHPKYVHSGIVVRPDGASNRVAIVMPMKVTP